METLKRSRKGHKAHITVLRGKLVDILDRKEPSELKNLRESLTKAIGKVEVPDEQISLLISDEDSLTTEITQSGEYSFDVRTDIHKSNEAITITLPGAPCVPAKFRGVA